MKKLVTLFLAFYFRWSEFIIRVKCVINSNIKDKVVILLKRKKNMKKKGIIANSRQWEKSMQQKEWIDKEKVFAITGVVGIVVGVIIGIILGLKGILGENIDNVFGRFIFGGFIGFMLGLFVGILIGGIIYMVLNVITYIYIRKRKTLIILSSVIVLTGVSFGIISIYKEAKKWSSDILAWNESINRNTPAAYKKYIRKYPNGTNVQQAEKLIIDREVDEIFGNRKYGTLPSMDKTSQECGEYTEISVSNLTGYTLTLRYSGNFESKSIIIPAETKRTISLINGQYRVTASAKVFENVRNYAGTEELTGGSYNVEYYLKNSIYDFYHREKIKNEAK